MEPTLAVGQRVLVNRIGMHFSEPPRRRDRRSFTRPKAPRRSAADSARASARAARPARSLCRKRRRRQLHQAHRRPGRATKSTISEGHVFRKAKGTATSQGTTPTSGPAPGASGSECNFTSADQDSARPLVHDGRQPWGIRRQPVLGTRPHGWIIGGAFATYWPPDDRHPLASPRDGRKRGSSARARRRARRGGSGRRLFAFDRRLGVPLDRRRRRGRPRLPGRARWSPRRAVRLRRADDARAAALSALNDSKQHTTQAREELFPLVLRSAARLSWSRAACAASTPAGCTRPTSPRCGMRDRRDARRARRGALPLRRLPGARTSDAPSGRSSTATRPAPRSPRPRSSPRSRRDRYMRHADASIPAGASPSTSATRRRVHREAIMRHGVSPLHRMSFQSLAYQQLAL